MPTTPERLPAGPLTYEDYCEIPDEPLRDPSPSTVERDRKTKAQIYARFRIPLACNIAGSPSSIGQIILAWVITLPVAAVVAATLSSW